MLVFGIGQAVHGSLFILGLNVPAAHGVQTSAAAFEYPATHSHLILSTVRENAGHSTHKVLPVVEIKFAEQF